MRTRQIKVYYKATSDSITPPPQPSLDRKDLWVKEVQKTIEPEFGFKIIEVTYRVVNPEIEQMQNFFNGPVVEYYTIQSAGILTGQVPNEMRQRYREHILSELLGYEVELVGRKERRRKSTTDFQETQSWNDFLERLRETMFEPNGYEMPDSEAFWALAEKYGYEQAKTISIEGLQARTAAKLGADRSR